VEILKTGTVSPVSSRLMVMAAALLFSTGGAAVKLCSMTAWQIASYRSGIAALTVLLLLPKSRRGWTWRTFLVGLAYASTLTLYVVANTMTTAASTTFLQSTAPLYVVLLGPLLLAEKVRSRDLGYMLLFLTGTALFFVGHQPASGTAPSPTTGNLVAAAAGLCWALTIIGLRWLGRDHLRHADGAAGAVACGNLIAFAAVLPLAAFGSRVDPSGWWPVIYLGVVQVGLAYVFLTRGVRTVPAFEAALLLMLEPVFNPVWAWLIHRENPGSMALLGGALICAATVIYSWQTSRGRSTTILRS